MPPHAHVRRLSERSAKPPQLKMRGNTAMVPASYGPLRGTNKVGMGERESSADLTRRLPGAVVLYGALGLLDFGFTVAAFRIGAYEVNPVLAWFLLQGLFEFAKLSLTLLVICLAVRFWSDVWTRRMLLFGNVIMTGVLLYHLNVWLGVSRF